MNSAKFENSPRLQRVLSVLFDGEPVNCLSISRRAHTSNVQQCIRELRENGFPIVIIREKESFTSPINISYQYLKDEVTA